MIHETPQQTGIKAIEETLRLVKSYEDYSLEISKYVTYKNFWKWRKYGLIDESSILDGARSVAGKDKVTTKLNLHGYFWVRIIGSLKDFGMRTEKVEKLKDVLFQKIDILNLYEGLSEEEVIHFISSADQVSDKDKEMLRKYVESGRFWERIKDSKVDHLLLMLYRLLYLRHDVKLLVRDDGSAFFFDPYYSAEPLEQLLGSAPTIVLSLRHYLIDLMTDPKQQGFISRYGWLSDQELKILEILRDKEVNYVRIKYKAGKPQKVMVDREKKIQASARVSQYLLSGGYEDILIKASSGKISYSVRTEKIIFEDTKP